MITDCDIFWRKTNIYDIKYLIDSFKVIDKCKMLLVRSEKSSGINKNTGDFIIENNKIKRWRENTEIIFYSGMQLISSKILKKY